MRQKLIATWSMAILLAVAIPAGAITIPEPKGFVNDYVGILKESDRANLESRLHQLAEGDGPEIAVATVQSLEGDTPQNYAVELFKAWKIGKKAKDNGILLLIAPNERKIYITTGYGVEGALPDVAAKRIITDVITPKYRSGDKSGAVVAGIDAIIARLTGEEKASPPAEETDSSGLIFLLAFAALIVVMIIVAAIIARRRSIHKEDDDYIPRRENYTPAYSPQPSSRSNDDLTTGVVVGSILSGSRDDDYGGSSGGSGGDGGSFGGFGGGDTGGGGAGGDL